jgi:hypothetical protein
MVRVLTEAIYASLPVAVFNSAKKIHSQKFSYPRWKCGHGIVYPEPD